VPYFFLSYAKADGDGYMDQFYGDLCDAVRARTGARAAEVGFRDRTDIELGADWPARLTEALATARVLVAVCSPSYFRSEVCGKEWQLFTRIDHQRRGSGDRPANLLPITWVRSPRLPEAARRLQSTAAGLGELYEQEGLHFLLKLRRYRDEYNLFVMRLADRIVDVADPEPPSVPDVLPDVESVSSAFAAPARSTTRPSTTRPSTTAAPGGDDVPVVAPTFPTTGPSGPPSPASPAAAVSSSVSSTNPSSGGTTTSMGPRHVNFVVVAASRAQMAQVREDVRFYGSSPHDWAPYVPLSTHRICVFAQRVASDNDLTSALDASGRSVLDLLARAEEQNEIVVLLVDVWATKLGRYSSLMFEYDQRNAPTSAVMVPWSSTDDEMLERTDELRNSLRVTFPQNTTRADVAFHPEIATLDEFRTALEEVFAVIQARIFSVGTVIRRAGGKRVVPRPILGSDL
jgi:FxsC-like protein